MTEAVAKVIVLVSDLDASLQALDDVAQLGPIQHFEVDAATAHEGLGWPRLDGSIRAAALGRSPGLVELVEIPSALAGEVVAGTAVLSFSLRDVEGRAAAATSAGRDVRGPVDLVVDGGRANGGPASTVVDCSGRLPVILRVGAIPADEIASVLGRAGIEHSLRAAISETLAAMPQPAADFSAERVARAILSGDEVTGAEVLRVARALQLHVSGVRDDRAKLIAALAAAVRAEVVSKKVAGSHWGLSGGCGTQIEDAEPADGERFAMACGMGHVPAKSARFLYFFAKLPWEREG